MEFITMAELNVQTSEICAVIAVLCASVQLIGNRGQLIALAIGVELGCGQRFFG